MQPFCLGGNVFGWTIDEPKSFQILDAFIDAGFHFIDTADVYSKWAHGNKGGESETILGKWFQRSGKRDKVVLATKVGMEMGPEHKGLSRSYITHAVEDSLRRLQTDHIDLYQSHTDDQTVPLEETLEAFASLVKAGKVRAIGASNYTGPRLAAALKVSESHGLPRYETLQPQYNLAERSDYEKNLEPVCEQYQLGVIPYFSLAAGFLTGKYRSQKDLENRARAPVAGKYMNDRGLRILKALDNVAERHNATPAQIALAWLIARPSITAPIASATSVDQLHDLLHTTRLKLDQASIKELNDASDESDQAAA